jgi:hypothetical protein
MIFLSHSRTTKQAARRLVEALALESMPAWIDEQQLDGGEGLRTTILEAIAKSDIYLYLVSAAANASPWVQEELKFALGLGSAKLRMIPVQIAGDGTELPPLLRDRMYRSLEIAAGGAAPHLGTQMRVAHRHLDDGMAEQLLSREQAPDVLPLRVRQQGWPAQLNRDRNVRGALSRSRPCSRPRGSV